jgi:hypothetical protein
MGARCVYQKVAKVLRGHVLLCVCLCFGLGRRGRNKYSAPCATVDCVFFESGEPTKRWDSGSLHLQLVCRGTLSLLAGTAWNLLMLGDCHG